jgi:hypothetical protein
MTSRNGVNWSERQSLADFAEGHYQISWRWNDKVGTAFNYHPQGRGLNWRTNLYYVETGDFGKTWCNAAGTKIAVPIREVKNEALVHDYEADKRLVYLKDITFDRQGRPVILYLTSGAYKSGPASGPRIWTTARWTREKWEINGSIESDNNYDMGSLYIELNDMWRIIAPTEPGPQRYNPGGEVAIWTSRDRGRSWQKEKQLTRDSEYNHTYVRRPVNAHPDFYGFWADGHGRQPSPSRLYITDQSGRNVRRLPFTMESGFERPEPIR